MSVNINKNILVINLSENPIVEDIQIVGIKKQSVVDILLEEILLKNRKPFDEYILSSDINLIQNMALVCFYYICSDCNVLR